MLKMTTHATRAVIAVCCAIGVLSVHRANAAAPGAPDLKGTWSLVAADVVHADGTRARDYGAAPKGMLQIDAEGNYSLQIFKAERPRFATSEKLAGTSDEFKAAVMGSSTHFGTISADASAHTLTFNIENASFPNWEGTQQKRSYELTGDQLSYRVPARPDGNTPISVWKRLK